MYRALHMGTWASFLLHRYHSSPSLCTLWDWHLGLGPGWCFRFGHALEECACFNSSDRSLTYIFQCTSTVKAISAKSTHLACTYRTTSSYLRRKPGVKSAVVREAPKECSPLSLSFRLLLIPLPGGLLIFLDRTRVNTLAYRAL